MIVVLWLLLRLAVQTKQLLLSVGGGLWLCWARLLLNSLILLPCCRRRRRRHPWRAMGCCLCKQKTRGDRTDSPCQGTSAGQGGGPHSGGTRNAINGMSGPGSGRTRSGSAGTTSNQSASQQSIDSLVMETLDLIRILVDNDMEPPQALITLHKVAERDQGWLSVVKSLIRTIPMDDPLGPAVIILLLDESPLPTKEVLVKMRTSLKLNNGTVARTYREPRYIRNILVILGCLAEKLAGPSSVSLLSSDVLQFLLHNLNPQQHPMVILHSIVALEKFALTRENKVTISTALETMQPHPLLALEQWRDEKCCVRREIGFCANWCLDNVFPIANRSYTYENLDLKELNVMLNDNDVSEYLKISPTGLEARCDASSFESVRCTFQVDSGVWYYEVTIITPGVMQIGWATKDSKFLNHEGYGIGDDEFSMAYDGCRKLMWYSAHREPHDHPCWQPGDVLGLLLDVDRHKLIFSLNGHALPAYNQLFSYARSGFFAAASFMSFQQCKFNFGYEPFKFPPDVPFQSFNSHGTLTDDQRVILPRHKKLELLKQITIKEDSCTLCFDNQASVQLKPCNHKGFCEVCVLQLEICPICRTEIQDRDQVSLTSNTNASPAQGPTATAASASASSSAATSKSEPRPADPKLE